MKGNISYSVLPGADGAQALLLPQSPISCFTLPAQLSKGLSPLSPLLLLQYRTTPWMLLIQCEEWLQMEMWKKKKRQGLPPGIQSPLLRW